MPHYNFHVRDGAGFAEDDEGVELADDEAARLVALVGARSLMVTELQGGTLDLSSSIEVDRDGEPLFTVTFDNAVEIKGMPAVVKVRS